jgi:hypothetical protein
VITSNHATLIVDTLNIVQPSSRVPPQVELILRAGLDHALRHFQALVNIQFDVAIDFGIQVRYSDSKYLLRLFIRVII